MITHCVCYVPIVVLYLAQLVTFYALPLYALVLRGYAVVGCVTVLVTRFPHLVAFAVADSVYVRFAVLLPRFLRLPDVMRCGFWLVLCSLHVTLRLVLVAYCVVTFPLLHALPFVAHTPRCRLRFYTLHCCVTRTFVAFYVDFVFTYICSTLCRCHCICDLLHLLFVDFTPYVYVRTRYRILLLFVCLPVLTLLLRLPFYVTLLHYYALPARCYAHRIIAAHFATPFPDCRLRDC